MINKNIKTLTNNLNVKIRHTEMALLAGFILATSVPMPVYEAELAKQVDEHKSNHSGGHEREEPAPHYSSYGSLQRTPARSGSV